MKCLLFFIFLLILPGLSAQYSTNSKRAIKKYKQAALAYDQKNYKESEKLLLGAVKSDKNFIEAYLLLGQIFIEKKNIEKGIETFHKAIAIHPDFFPNIYYNLGLLEFKIGRYKDAKEHTQKFLSYRRLNQKLRNEAKSLLQSCNFAIHAIENPVPFNPVNLGDNVNSEYDDMGPSLSLDEKSLVFTVRLPKNKNIEYSLQNSQEDFYITKKENGVWKEAKDVGEPLNTLGNEGAQSLSADGKTLFFTACNRPSGYGLCDIYFSTLKDEKWTNPLNIGRPINSPKSEKQPSISPDGQTLYFISNKLGGKGGYDIYMSELTEDGYWGTPINLGDSINTPGNEQTPFIHPDNKSLFFCSDFHPGMGGYDIFVAKKVNKSWGKPRNLGYPINTLDDELGLIVNAGANKAYYSSNRDGAKKNDLFEFDLNIKDKPTPVSYMKGTVHDLETRNKLKASFELIDLNTGEIVMRSFSDYRTGEFMVPLPTDNDYALNVSKAGYLFYSENFTLSGIHEKIDPYLMDIDLKSIKVGEKIILKNIFYETGAYKLKQSSYAELNKLIEFLKRNASLKVEISGYTDNIGANTINIQLSENRAKAVVNYLISNGANALQLSYKGYGEEFPVADNNTEEGRAKNRRTELKIIGE